MRTLLSHFLLWLTPRQPRCTSFDQKCRDFFASFSILDLGKYREQVGGGAIGNVALRAIDKIAVAVSSRSRADRADIRASFRFRQSKCTDHLSRRQPRKVFVFL